MGRRQRLTEAQIAALYDPPTDARDLARHCTLSPEDLASIARRRGDHSRLGHALMLLYLRHPGRPLRAGERPPAALVAFVAEGVGAAPEALGDYLASEQNRRRHAAELAERLGLRPSGPRAAAELTGWLLPHAIKDDRLAHLAGLVLEECRRRRVVIPPPRTLERLCLEVRHRARREVHRRLTDGLSPDQRRRLDALTGRRGDTGGSWLAWLRGAPEATKPSAMLGLVERLRHVRAVGLDAGHGRRVHAARLARLAREAGRTTVQHIAGYERGRRHATLAATALDVSADLTDAALDLFDRLVGAMFRKAEGRHARDFQSDGRAINDKVRLYARVGGALLAARADGRDAFAALDAVIPWERFRASVEEAEALARPEEFDAYAGLGEHHAGVRRWAPAFLGAFEFGGVPAVAPLLRAVSVLRDVNRAASPRLPRSVPIAFVRERWARHVLPAGAAAGPDRRYYEICVLSELRDRLRAGDVWVAGSRRHRSFEERLVSREALRAMQEDGTLPVAVDPDFDRFTAARRDLLAARLAAVDRKARGGLLPEVTLERGVLKVAPVQKSTPPEAEALAARLYAVLPRVRITDLLAEVARWTLFPDCFTHLRTGEAAPDSRVLMAVLLADGLNLGLTRMAEACDIASLGRLAWTADWHVRDETYALALRCLVDRQGREPLAARFGAGAASSSDGQFFRAGGPGRDAARLNAHYGDAPGTKFYTHLSDRYAPFHTKVIAATASEAIHVLDGLLHHGGEVATSRHHTDGGGDSEHVFALCTTLGFAFAPRIPDLKNRRLHVFGRAADHPALEPLVAGRIDVALIRAHWPDILRITASIRTGTVTASLIMRQLGIANLATPSSGRR